MCRTNTWYKQFNPFVTHINIITTIIFLMTLKFHLKQILQKPNKVNIKRIEILGGFALCENVKKWRW